MARTRASMKNTVKINRCAWSVRQSYRLKPCETSLFTFTQIARCAVFCDLGRWPCFLNRQAAAQIANTCGHHSRHKSRFIWIRWPALGRTSQKWKPPFLEGVVFTAVWVQLLLRYRPTVSKRCRWCSPAILDQETRSQNQAVVLHLSTPPGWRRWSREALFNKIEG